VNPPNPVRPQSAVISKRRLRLLLCVLTVSWALLLGLASSSLAMPLGVMWSGDIEQSKTTTEWNVIQHSGAGLYRVFLYKNLWETQGPAAYDPIFRHAAENNITVLPYLWDGGYPAASDTTAMNGWRTFCEEVVRRYGYSGSFWSGKPFYKPVTAWEVGNEPNLTQENQTYGGGGQANPQRYAQFLISVSNKIKEASKAQSAGQNTTVLMGGLYLGKVGEENGSMKWERFLNEAYGVAGFYSSFDGISIHPYGFDFEHSVAANKTIAETTSEITAIRNSLSGKTGGPSRTLWVTELGWPVGINPPGGATAVDDANQSRLLNESFNWIKSHEGVTGQAKNNKIESLIWYNLRDDNSKGDWAYRDGLLRDDRSPRPAWGAFQSQTGAASWTPGPEQAPGVETLDATEVQDVQATVRGTVDPHGLPTSYRFEYGTTMSYGNSTPAESGGDGEGAIPKSVLLTGLQTGTTYHFRIVATNSVGSTPGADRTFTTRPVVVAFRSNTNNLLIYSSATGTKDLGMGMKPGTGPSIAPKSDGSYIVAFQTNTGELFTYSPITGTKDIGGMAAGTSPDVTWLPDGNYVVAFQANNGNLYTYSSGTGLKNLGMGMKPGTGPSIAAKADGSYVVAFQANTGNLVAYSSNSNTWDTGLAVKPETSPSVSAAYGNAYTLAFQGNDGNLFILRSTVRTTTNIGGMATGTSPSASVMADGSVDAAFQANTNNLLIYSSATGTKDLGMGMKPGTGPSIAPKSDGSYIVAFQTNTGELFTYSPITGTKDIGGMAAGTSPDVTWLPDGNYVVAFQANNGNLYTYSSGTGLKNLGMGMKPGTSPSIAAKANGDYVIAFQTNEGELLTYSPLAGVTDTDVSPRNSSSPSLIILPSGNYEVALTSSTDYALLYTSTSASAELGLGMGLAGSPSLAVQ
jgi:hypothetical protein